MNCNFMLQAVPIPGSSLHLQCCLGLGVGQDWTGPSQSLSGIHEITPTRRWHRILRMPGLACTTTSAMTFSSCTRMTSPVHRASRAWLPLPSLRDWIPLGRRPVTASGNEKLALKAPKLLRTHSPRSLQHSSTTGSGHARSDSVIWLC